MSDIKKRFVLEASLDDSRLREDLRKLKASVKDLDIGRSDVDTLRDAFKDITKQFSKDIQAAIKAAKGTGNPGAGRPAGSTNKNDNYNYSKYKDAGKAESQRDLDLELKRQADKELKLKITNEKKLNRERQVIVKKNLNVAKKHARELFKYEEQQKKAAGVWSDRGSIGQSTRSDKELEDMIGGLTESIASKANSKVVKKITEKSGIMESLTGMATKYGGRMTGLLAKGLGGIGGVAAGIGGVALGGIAAAGVANQFASQRRETRNLQAMQNQEQAMSMLSGNFTDVDLARSARQDQQSGFTGFVSGMGGVSDKLFSLSLSDKLSIFSGDAYRQGQLKQGAEELDTRRQQSQLAMAAEQSAIGQVPGRVNLLRGGGISENEITAAQLRGASKGFTAQESLQQLNDIRGTLGNRTSMDLLTRMQGIQNQTGMSVSEQALNMDTLAGANQSSYGASQQAQVEILKKGVSAGLDVSKSGKFLQTTAQFIGSTQGLGTLNTDAISTELAELAKGFAGEGPVTNTALQQAQALAQAEMQESMSLTGLSGAANITGLQKMFTGDMALDSGTFLAASRLDKNATEEDIRSVLGQQFKGKDLDKAVDLFGQSKEKGTMESLLKDMGVDKNLSRFLIGQETGQGTRGVLGRERGKSGKGTIDTEGVTLGKGPEGASFDTQVKQAQISAATTAAGIQVLETSAKNASTQLDTFVDQLSESVEKLREFQREIGNNKMMSYEK